MKSTNPLKELEAHFQSFINEKDYDKFCHNLTSYFQFIEDTYPFNEIAQRLFTARSSPAILYKVSGLYQMFVNNKRDPRFSISPLSVGGSGVSTFHNLLIAKAKQLGLAMDENGFLLLKDDFFTYNNSKLKVPSNTYAYIILKTIYQLLDGKSGEISYKDLFKELRKTKRFKQQTDSWILDKVQKNITANSYGLGKKIKKVENNGLRLVEVVKNHGLRFNNQ